MIISASRRTDIPAFYTPWLINRIRAGFCTVPNPYNPAQVSYVSLTPQDVDVFAFSTRNPRPILPHLKELDERGYHYVIVERGEELSRITTGDIDKLLYHVFEGVTFNLACEYELKHRVWKRDVRRLLFRHQIELLSVLSPHWAEIESQDHARILSQHPFDDSLTHS